MFQVKTKDSNDLPRAYPGQNPVLRTLPQHVTNPTLLLETEEERSESPRISEEALHKLKEIIEAQKAFLKYQEMRKVLESRTTRSKEEEDKQATTGINDSYGHVLQSRTQRRKEDIEEGKSEAKNSDSDKENSVTITTSRSGRVRKVAKLRREEDSEKGEENPGRKRKSPSEGITIERAPVPVKSPRY